MTAQQKISASRLAAKIGSTMDVIVDQIEGNVAVARTKGDAPEVDGIVEINDFNQSLSVGDIVKVVVKDSSDYDLIGQLAV